MVDNIVTEFISPGPGFKQGPFLEESQEEKDEWYEWDEWDEFVVPAASQIPSSRSSI